MIAVLVLAAAGARAAGDAPDGPSDDLVAAACSTGLLVRPDSANAPGGDGGAGFAADARRDFPGLFGAGNDAAARGGTDSSKTQLLRPSGNDASACPDQVRGFYARYGDQVTALPAPNLDASEIQGRTDRLFALVAGPGNPQRLSVLTGSSLQQTRAIVDRIFDGVSRLDDAGFAAANHNLQALAAGRSGRVLSQPLEAPFDPAALLAAPAPARAAAPTAPQWTPPAATAAYSGPLSEEQRQRWALHGFVPPVATPPGAQPAPKAASLWNQYAPISVQNAVSRAGSWVADKIWGGGNPAVNVEMPADTQNPPRWRRVRFGNYGTAAMIKGLIAVGEDMGKLGAPTLQIGDISQKGGGTFRHHLSHKIGKDVDIFFITDPHGRFDARWNLLLAATAVKDLNVTHIFVDTPLKNEMERYLRANPQLPADERADMAKALSKMQYWPGHDTHFHIRIDY
jgi:murein endopeptidase